MMRVLNLDAHPNEAVMAGFIPAIHALPRGMENVDARQRRHVYAVCVKQTAIAGHDDAERVTP
ncbi:hypothetical protein XH88_09470 [Bradyrhizobium sp. CCBAU 51627]|nr:hypothetical protein [Bradyrhizobium sp. CCBAU 51627]